MRLAAHGLRADLPAGWEGTIRGPTRDDRWRALSRGEATYPSLHAATFPLPADAGDFGGGVVELMSTRDVFVALLEYGEDSLGTPLFARRGLPRRLRASELTPRTLHRTIAGHAGVQVFATEAQRAFCLYVVVGDARRRGPLVAAVNQVLGSLVIEPAS